MNDVNKLIGRHYQKQRLAQHRKQSLRLRLQQAQRSESQQSKATQPARHGNRLWPLAQKFRWYHYGTVAMLLVLSVGLIHTNLLDGERSEKALRAAALYHKTKLQLDFEGQSIEQLRNKMDELPFELTLPEAANLQQFSLVGGRYCSINGQLAVHLRFVDRDSSRQYSLFQTALAPQLKRLDLADAEIDGMSVRLWSEDRNFYVQAGG